MYMLVDIYKEKKEKDFRMIIVPNGKSEIGLNQTKDYGIISYLGRGEEEKINPASEREAQKQLDQASRISAAYPDGRPTKRDRRQLDRMKRDSW